MCVPCSLATATARGIDDDEFECGVERAHRCVGGLDQFARRRRLPGIEAHPGIVVVLQQHGDERALRQAECGGGRTVHGCQGRGPGPQRTAGRQQAVVAPHGQQIGAAPPVRRGQEFAARQGARRRVCQRVGKAGLQQRCVTLHGAELDRTAPARVCLAVETAFVELQRVRQQAVAAPQHPAAARARDELQQCLIRTAALVQQQMTTLGSTTDGSHEPTTPLT